MPTSTILSRLLAAGVTAACTVVLAACASTPRETTTPTGEVVALEQAPAEEAWIVLEDAAQSRERGNAVMRGFGTLTGSSLGDLAAQFNEADDEATRATQRADVPIQLFEDLRDTVVAELAETLPAIAREKGYLQYLYVGRFVDQSSRAYPELQVRLHSVASFLQQNTNFNETVRILPSSFSQLGEVTSEIEQGLLAQSPTGAPSGVNRRDVWVLTGTFAVSPRKQNRESNAIINLELTNLGDNNTIARSSERTYYFHPAKSLMRFISEEENQTRWAAWRNTTDR